MRFRSALLNLLAFLSITQAGTLVAHAATAPDFQREIRPILSNNCFHCHGPDQDERKGGKDSSGGLRLDTEEGARAALDDGFSIVPGDPEKSAVIQRIVTEDRDDLMPPKKTGKKLTAREVDLLKRWIASGAKYAQHWSYEKPKRHPVPEISDAGYQLPITWGNPIDAFLFQRLEREHLTPAPEADRATLLRRVSLDLTGLPPTLEEADTFLADTAPDAYERLVDRLLASPAYGEHWGRMWLDLARYADSAGYADDPPRIIWAYRDYVINAFNRNLPFDQFTIEQLAGDLLPNPAEEQLIATAFHRNTMTNNEGGTQDEEFRNAAIVDRTNTTMAVWMGTSYACAQCHTHKYDPITQHEYYKLFAFLNNTADADKKDESPLLEFFTAEKAAERSKAQTELTALDKVFANPPPAALSGLTAWIAQSTADRKWQTPRPVAARSSSGGSFEIADDGRVFNATAAPKTTDTIELPAPTTPLAALRIEALADDRLPGKGPGHSGGNFVLSRVHAEFVPETPRVVQARHLRIEKVSTKYDFLALAEVQIFSGSKNIARSGKAAQISTTNDREAADRAIDGKTDGDLEKGKSVALTGGGESPQWWEIDLGKAQTIDRVVVWGRRDKGKGQFTERLIFTLFDDAKQPVWSGEITRKSLATREEISVSGRREILFTRAFADAAQTGFEPRDVLAESAKPDKGWAIAGSTGATRTLTLLPDAPESFVEPGRLIVTLAQVSKFASHTLGAFRIGTTSDRSIATLAPLPAPALAALAATERTAAQDAVLRDYYVRNVAPELKREQQRAATLRKELDALKPDTVPVMRELADAQRRKTSVQIRGNYLSLGDAVTEGVPAAFHPLPQDAPMNRLTLAKWLVDEANPLTARVIANRFWEQLFGIGIVRTSEEFGAQGDLPEHPELLDWLATELVRLRWDMKAFVKLLVTTHAYRQASKATPDLLERDPDNRLLARGPRLRMSAEVVRDHALAVSGLLSLKMLGPSVRPPRPELGLKAAFGRLMDWETSQGEDRYRRALYTEARRTSPYPSMATFDAPSRETCTLRRDRTNTPLQALVTLNDPVYVEAAQALARRMNANSSDPKEKARLGFRLCLTRVPTDAELDRLIRMHDEAFQTYKQDEKAATEMASNPFGPVPAGADVADLAAWTTVANVLLNLDETLMKR